ncbi:MAG: two-component system regulatory protein YycI [Thermotaleaceae bacterium]
MDWSKAKNILIIAFIITNLFLIFSIEKGLYEDNSMVILKEKNIEDVISILSEKGIRIETEIPRILLEMPVLDVEYETYNEDKVRMRFSHGRGISPKNKEKNIEVTKNKIFISIENGNSPSIQGLSQHKAREVAEKYIKDHEYMKSDVEYWKTFHRDGQYEVIFKQKYKGYFLEKSYMRLLIDVTGVIEFERMWLTPVSTGTYKNEIMPATKALLKAMQMLEDRDKEVVITDIHLGYLFDPSRISLTNWENIKSGRALPAWRVTLKDGETLFIDAYEDY